MTKLKNNQAASVAAVAGVLLLIGVAAWLVVVSPQRSHAAKLKTQIASLNQEIADRRAATAAAARQTQQIQTADLFRLTKAMPDQTDMPGILLELSRVARETGIQFQSITPETAAALNGYQVVPINLVFQGDYYDLADFVYRLRNLVVVHGGDLTATGRLFSVDSIDFAEGELRFPQIQATLTVDAYVYGVTAPMAAPGTATPAPTTTGGTTATTPTTTAGTTTSLVPSPTTPPLPPVSANAAGASN